MEQQSPSGLGATAIEWQIRLQHGDAATWEEFALWLEADAGNAAAYDRVERADDGLGDLLSELRRPVAATPVETPSRPVRRTTRWPVWGGALAASIVAAVVIAPRLADSHYDVSTGPGEQRSLTVDGTSMTLNGATTLILDRRNPRIVELARGEALFAVRHDMADPFRLDLGGAEVQDVGTVFNAVRQDGEVRVAVAEGAVSYNPEGEAVELRAGDSLFSRRTAAHMTVTRTDPANIGSWRSGRLVFDHEPLSRVAADLGRALGTPVAVSPVIAARPFSGVLQLDKSGPKQLTRLALVLQVDMHATKDGWTMGPGRIAAH